ncbi:type IV pilus modification protein PilV [Acinetobacter nectaris]|uniref:type IV pilus modification protein PilV n=1 Tax=Acinetobacter nectaris TaxID=1219382 RepID=UPI001F1E2780|nr:type IV pilus modification protein PilV [Acinetobacter nectaris]MCF9027183.1 type IV pilus modification protein PilV [Acinetobacter nectaris]
MRTYQSGVGLMEVLVALFVLAIGVLGFIALQYRAGEATIEANNRVQAMNVARNLAEQIRINSTAQASYTGSLSGLQSSNNCFNNSCSPTQKAAFDLAQTASQASNLGMQVAIITCPLALDGRQCIYVAWNKTDPVDSTATTQGHVPCTQSTSNGFSYSPDSTCVVMEAY